MNVLFNACTCSMACEFLCRTRILSASATRVHLTWPLREVIGGDLIYDGARFCGSLMGCRCLCSEHFLRRALFGAAYQSASGIARYRIGYNWSLVQHL